MRYAHEQQQDSSTGWRTPHGERRTYLAGCHCDDCVRAHSRYCKERTLRRLQGEEGTVPFATFAAALERARAETRLDDSALARACGLSAGTLRKAWRRQRPVRAATYRALMDAGEPPSGLVPAGLTRYRLRSLMRAGWSMDAVEARTGVKSLAGGRWRGTERVSVRFARDVRDLYAQMRDETGPNRQSSLKAQRLGYLHPWEWDDPGTLAWPPDWATAPEEGPDVDPVAVDRWLRGDDTIELTDDEKTEVARIAHERGVSHVQVQRRLRISGTTFARIREGRHRAPRRGPQRRTPAA